MPTKASPAFLAFQHALKGVQSQQTPLQRKRAIGAVVASISMFLDSKPKGDPGLEGNPFNDQTVKTTANMVSAWPDTNPHKRAVKEALTIVGALLDRNMPTLLDATRPYVHALYQDITVFLSNSMRWKGAPRANVGAFLHAFCGHHPLGDVVLHKMRILGFSTQSHDYFRGFHALLLHANTLPARPIDHATAVILARTRMEHVCLKGMPNMRAFFAALDTYLMRTVPAAAWRDAIQAHDHDVMSLAVVYALAGPQVTIQAMMDTHHGLQRCPYSGITSNHQALALLATHFPPRESLQGLLPQEQGRALCEVMYAHAEWPMSFGA